MATQTRAVPARAAVARRRIGVGVVVQYGVLVLLLLLSLYPIFLMVSMSLRPAPLIYVALFALPSPPILDHYRTALVCTSELSANYLSYDIQTVRDLHMKSAGLTIGNAAACMLLRSTPFPGGGLRLLTISTHTAPDHWHLCQVPVDGTLSSSSVELICPTVA